MSDPVKVARGKKSKAAGGIFENRVRLDLEEKDWIVDKWTNNVEIPRPGMVMDVVPITKKLSNGTWSDAKPPFPRLVKAKNKWAGPGRPMMMGAGFPDFICFKKPMMITGYYKDTKEFHEEPHEHYYEVIGVESKLTGKLDKIEKEKCKWLLDNRVFSKILIAEKTKVKNRVVIVYHDFKEKYWRFYK